MSNIERLEKAAINALIFIEQVESELPDGFRYMPMAMQIKNDLAKALGVFESDGVGRYRPFDGLSNALEQKGDAAS